MARVKRARAGDEAQIRRIRESHLRYTDLWEAQERERELTPAIDLWSLADILGKREAAGDAAGFDRLRADREVTDVDASRGLASADRARAQATLAGFLPRRGWIEAVRPRNHLTDVADGRRALGPRRDSRGDLALARELDAAGFAEQAAARRSIPEPEVVAGTKTSNAVGGDVGSILSVHVSIPLFDRARPERALAQARGRQARAESRLLRQTIRAQIASWRAAVVERSASRRALSRHSRQAGQVRSSGSRRSATTPASAASSSCSTRIATASTARVRQAALDAASARRKSSSNS